MIDYAKVEWVKGICQSLKPEDLPKHYVDFYDLVARRCHQLTGNQDPNKTSWPIMAACAERLHAMEERIAKLEAERTTSTTALSVAVDVPAVEEPRKRVKSGQLIGA